MLHARSKTARWLRISLAAQAWLLIRSGILTATTLDSAMEHDPPLPPVVYEQTIAGETVQLWHTALHGAEVELRREAAMAMGRAHLLGIRGMNAEVPLIERLSDEHLSVRLQAARTLVIMGAAQAAPTLMHRAQVDGMEMAQIVEPALAKWSHEPMIETWRSRIQQPHNRPHALKLAIEGLGTVGDRESVDVLSSIVLDEDRPPDVRLAAARAMAAIGKRPHVDIARSLLDSHGALDRLLAANLFSPGPDDASKALAAELCQEGSPAATAEVLRRCLELETRAIERLPLDRLITSPDATVRRLAVGLLTKKQSPDTVAQLVATLDDAHSSVRNAATEALLVLAQEANLRDAVAEMAMSVISENSSAGPLGTEQAVCIVGVMNHEPAAPRLIELLEHDAPPVTVAAAWALRRLAVPETGEAILSKVREETRATVELVESMRPAYRADPNANVPLPPLASKYDMVEHLIEALGQIAHQAAEPELRRYLPKPAWQVRGEPPSVETFKQDRLRAAAIWSLGHIYRSTPPDAVLVGLQERLTDEAPIPREAGIVRRMAAATLGRLKIERAEASLQDILDRYPKNAPLTQTCRWALEQITGRPLAAPDPERVEHVDWFLRHVADAPR